MKFTATPVRRDQDLDPREAARVIDYLTAGTVVFAAPGWGEDELDPARSLVVPLRYHCDGEWVWPASLAYYAETYGIFPEQDFVDRMRNLGFTPPAVPSDVIAQVAEQMMGPAQPPPVPPPPATVLKDRDARPTPWAPTPEIHFTRTVLPEVGGDKREVRLLSPTLRAGASVTSNDSLTNWQVQRPTVRKPDVGDESGELPERREDDDE
ncbi:hypothetical protein [Cryobacterium sp. SO1]|uniref:hypothetical protein n=1 Tax=Cryobacterium sp. SO1 TaxID=1897061 RepID=UPI001022CE07|nr:hypothetical protein [Cryobacterium sp. SO1]RZI34297.1 hypothetical protein BJQ95_03438 [Cryobacterium sp. SO1]